jgi:hypothetical protein
MCAYFGAGHLEGKMSTHFESGANFTTVSTGVKIIIFSDFRQFFGEKMALFSKDKFFEKKSAVVSAKNANFCAKCWRKFKFKSSNRSQI